MKYKRVMFVVMLLLPLHVTFANDPLSDAILEGKKEGRAYVRGLPGNQSSDAPHNTQEHFDCSTLRAADAAICVTLPRAEAYERFFKKGESKTITSLAEKVEKLSTENTLLRAYAQGVITPSSSKSTIKGTRTVYEYSPDVVFEVHVSPLQMSVVQFQRGEYPVSYDLSDLRWEIAIAGESGPFDYLTIKAKDAGLESGLFVATNKRSYYFVLKTSEVHMPLVSFSNAKRAARPKRVVTKKPKRPTPPKPKQPTQMTPRVVNTHYMASENTLLWNPTAMFDDGTFTYISFSDEVQELPGFWKKVGEEYELVNTTVSPQNKHVLVIKEIFEHGILKIKADEIAITNERRITKEPSFLERVFG